MRGGEKKGSHRGAIHIRLYKEALQKGQGKNSIARMPPKVGGEKEEGGDKELFGEFE